MCASFPTLDPNVPSRRVGRGALVIIPWTRPASPTIPSDSNWRPRRDTVSLVSSHRPSLTRPFTGECQRRGGTKIFDGKETHEHQWTRHRKLVCSTLLNEEIKGVKLSPSPQIRRHRCRILSDSIIHNLYP